MHFCFLIGDRIVHRSHYSVGCTLLTGQGRGNETKTKRRNFLSMLTTAVCGSGALNNAPGHHFGWTRWTGRTRWTGWIRMWVSNMQILTYKLVIAAHWLPRIGAKSFWGRWGAHGKVLATHGCPICIRYVFVRKTKGGCDGHSTKLCTISKGPFC